MQNKIDIIINHYEDARILRALISITNHKDANKINIILINAYATDNLKRKIKQKLRKNDIFIDEPDNGIFDGFNKAMRYVKSKWLGFLGSDDFFNPYFSFKKIISSNYDLVSGSAIFFDHNKVILRIFKPLDAWNYFSVSHQATFIRSEIAKQHSYDNNFNAFADFFYFLQIRKDLKKILLIKDTVAFLESGGESNKSIIGIIKVNTLVFFTLLKKFGLLKAIYSITLKITSKILFKYTLLFNKKELNKNYNLLLKTLKVIERKV